MNADSGTAYRRARRALWICLAVAVGLTAALSATLGAPDSPITALAVVALGVLLATVLALAVRLLLALTGRLRPHGGGPPSRVGHQQRRRGRPDRGGR